MRPLLDPDLWTWLLNKLTSNNAELTSKLLGTSFRASFFDHFQPLLAHFFPPRPLPATNWPRRVSSTHFCPTPVATYAFTETQSTHSKFNGILPYPPLPPAILPRLRVWAKPSLRTRPIRRVTAVQHWHVVEMHVSTKPLAIRMISANVTNMTETPIQCKPLKNSRCCVKRAPLSRSSIWMRRTRLDPYCFFLKNW